MTVFQTRDHLSVMSGVTPEGRLVTLVRRQALRGRERISFLRHLAQYIGGRLLVIWCTFFGPEIGKGHPQDSLSDGSGDTSITQRGI